MSAVVAVLVVLAAALVAGLSTQVSRGWQNYAAEQPTDVAQSDETAPAPDDKAEPKRSHKQADKRSVTREQKQSEPACAQPCPATWPRHEMTPWPL
jgi:hypothetical protein